jgi:hypothetical protein
MFKLIIITILLFIAWHTTPIKQWFEHPKAKEETAPEKPFKSITYDSPVRKW